MESIKSTIYPNVTAQKIQKKIKKIILTKPLHPTKIILGTYAFLILLGTILLSLPFAHQGSLSLTNALFTATSATTVTGLIVVDTAKNFTIWGQLIILSLIQLGGLGYILFGTFFLLGLKNITLKNRQLLQTAVNYPGFYGLTHFLKRILPIIFFIELVGIVPLLLTFLNYKMPLSKALFHSVFHSVSAFNNAGFSSFSNNIIAFKHQFLFIFSMAILIILGGIGFFVINELLLYSQKKIKKISIHTKITLSITGFLIVLGTLIIFFTEFSYQPNIPLATKLTDSAFISVTARTAGFNIVEISSLSSASLLFIINLMFIGASPGGTGGGIKTVTFAIAFFTLWAFLNKKEDVIVFKRKIAEEYLKKAFSIILLSIFCILLMTFILNIIEKIDFLPSLFEVTSAFATVGLSTGNNANLSLTATFSNLGKLTIIICMLIGRIGILSFAIAFLRQEKNTYLKYPEERIII